MEDRRYAQRLSRKISTYRSLILLSLLFATLPIFVANSQSLSAKGSSGGEIVANRDEISNSETFSIANLPRNLWDAATQTAVKINPLNNALIERLRQAMPEFVPQPDQLAVKPEKYWGVEGVYLTVGFLDNPPKDLRARILSQMNAWGKTGNIQFVETNINPQVRITLTPDDGYWSYVGTDILNVEADQPTMNLGNLAMDTPDDQFNGVVLHETGHTLGFPHEHLRRELVERIDRNKAIAYYQETQGWTPEEVNKNVLTPLEESSIMGTTSADSSSIMCYRIPGEITKDGNPIMGGTEISSSDYEFVAQIYPKPSASDRVIVYTNSEYGGFGQTLAPGEYNSSKINDVISSVKVPAGRKAIFYSDVNFGGQTKTFTADTPYVGSDFNDQTSSIVIE